MSSALSVAKVTTLSASPNCINRCCDSRAFHKRPPEAVNISRRNLLRFLSAGERRSEDAIWVHHWWLYSRLAAITPVLSFHVFETPRTRRSSSAVVGCVYVVSATSCFILYFPLFYVFRSSTSCPLFVLQLCSTSRYKPRFLCLCQIILIPCVKHSSIYSLVPLCPIPSVLLLFAWFVISHIQSLSQSSPTCSASSLFNEYDLPSLSKKMNNCSFD